MATGDESDFEENTEKATEYDDEEEDIYKAIHQFKPQQDGDLELKVGELISIKRRNSDGWWEAENAYGSVGMVPSTYLQVCDDDDEASETENNIHKNDTILKKKSDHTDISENIQEHREKNAKEHWKDVQDAIHMPTDVTDVLSALGALPSGFRPSTLSNLLSNNIEYCLKNAVLPSLTESKIAFQDLHWDVQQDQIRSEITKVLRTCTIQNCSKVPTIGGGTEVLSRHVRVCLFDGTNVLSNIHTIRCYVSGPNQKLWKLAVRGKTPIPTQDFPTFTVRCNYTHANLGLLFEPGITYKRTVTGEKSDLSCGWAFLKLSEEQGRPIPSKSYKLKLNGGTPYEKGLDVDASIARRAPTNRFQALLAANRQPKICIVIGVPANAKKKCLNLLPQNIILPSNCCNVVALYRQVLADNLLRDRLSHRDADLIPSPILATFPDVVSNPDILDGLLTIWNDRIKILKAPDKRDKESMKKLFVKCFMETAYPLLQLSTLPPQEWGNAHIENQRRQKIFEFISKHRPVSGAVTDHQSVLKSMLAPNVDHKPFEVSEVCFDLIEDYGKDINIASIK